MTNESHDRNLDEMYRDDTADQDLGIDPRVESEGLVAEGSYPKAGAGAMGSPVSNQDWTGGGTGPDDGSGQVAEHAAEKAGAVAEAAASKAADVKDVALERGGDVAAAAGDELARLAHDARSQVQSLWSDAAGQLRGQASAGQQQAADLLHSLAGELGEMASKSENGGPLTALAKQAAAKGGEMSHWLANSEPTDVLTELRRFARRRPFVFLAGAALAGVVVGRLGRGLMAAAESDNTGPARLADAPVGSVPATAGVVTPPPVTSEDVPSFGDGEAPDLVEAYPAQAGLNDPYTPGGGMR